MKTKTIFMLAAMLLMSIGAFAQNNEPLEGDVNKDGKVDVADIVKVIDIMAAGEQPQPTVYYWYIGTDEYTLENYTSLTKVSEVPETGTVSASRQYIYCVVPNDKTVTFTDGQFTIVTDVVSNNEVNIYKTVSTFNGTLTYTIE